MVKILEPRCIERVLFAEASAGIERKNRCWVQMRGPKSGPPGGTKNGSAFPSSNSKGVQFADLKTGLPREPENRFNGSAFWM